MENTRPQAVAGVFYPDSAEELKAQIKFFEQNNDCDYEYKTRAVIVPHAGYVYSGRLASEGFECLQKDGVRNIFIFAPAHRVIVDNFALSNFKFWQTPLGEIEVNQEINRELAEMFDGEFYDEAHKEEHAIEVQIPFIQTYCEGVKIIPVLLGCCDYAKIAEIIGHYYKNPENAFVISSDLSHYYSDQEARKIDSVSAQMIENNEIEEFNAVQACGFTGIRALVKFARDNNHSLIRVGMMNSADAMLEGEGGGRDKVVGYGSWMLYENGSEVVDSAVSGGELGLANFIEKYFAPYAIAICKKSISSQFENSTEPVDLGHIPSVFMQFGACFVTLRDDGHLRGCIGSIVAHRTLIEDLIDGSHCAAFNDTRFSPLTLDEFKSEDFSISISILSMPKKIDFKPNDEEDLLEKIIPSLDGIIIKEGLYQAVYLPSVWECMPDKKQFLNSLKQKAGLNANHFSETFEAYRFRSKEIGK